MIIKKTIAITTLVVLSLLSFSSLVTAQEAETEGASVSASVTVARGPGLDAPEFVGVLDQINRKNFELEWSGEPNRSIALTRKGEVTKITLDKEGYAKVTFKLDEGVNVLKASFLAEDGSISSDAKVITLMKEDDEVVWETTEEVLEVTEGKLLEIRRTRERNRERIEATTDQALLSNTSRIHLETGWILVRLILFCVFGWITLLWRPGSDDAYDVCACVASRQSE
jgi:hypothetical protein